MGFVPFLLIPILVIFIMVILREADDIKFQDVFIHVLKS